MVHKLWITSSDCHNLAQLISHLRPRINLESCIVSHIESFLKLPELNIVACTETSTHFRYSFWNSSSPSFDFCRDEFPVGRNEGWLVGCDFNFQILAFNWASGEHYTVKVVSVHQQQDIADVIAPSVAFSHDGMKLAVPVFVSSDACIAIYDVIDSADGLLGPRREIFWPEPVSILLMGSSLQMAFSPNDESLVLSGLGRVGFIDAIDGTFTGWSRDYAEFDIVAIQYSPNGSFVVAVGNDLDSSDYKSNRWDGLIHMFNADSNHLWRLASEGTGEGLAGIDTLAFSSCSTKMACVAGGKAWLYIVDVDSAHAHRLTMTDSAKEVVFDTTGQRLITLHRSSMCIIDITSGTKFHEVLFSDSGLEILVISQLQDSNKENVLALTAMRSQRQVPELEGHRCRKT